MTLPDPEVPLVHSLHHAQQSRQDCEDELSPETMGPMRKQQKGKSNLHVEEDFVGKLESMNLDPPLSNLAHANRTPFLEEKDLKNDRPKKYFFLDICSTHDSDTTEKIQFYPI